MWSLRTRLLLLLTPFLLIGAFRLLLAVGEPYTPGENRRLKQKIRDSLELLSVAPEGAARAIFLGASETEVGIDASAFDGFLSQNGLRFSSLNLGMRDAGSTLPLVFLRVAHEIERSGRPADIIFVSLPTARLSKRAVMNQNAVNDFSELFSVYFHWEQLFEASLPLRARLELFVNKYLLGERSPMQFVVFATHLMRPLMPIRRLERAFGVTVYSLADDPRRPEASAADPFFHGIPESSPLLQELRQRLKDRGHFRSWIRAHRRCCDFLDPEFDPKYVHEVTDSLRKLKSVSRKLVLFEMPEHPEIPFHPDAARKKKELFLSVARDLDTDVIALPALEGSHFLDPVHLSPSGVEITTRNLAELAISRSIIKSESK